MTIAIECNSCGAAYKLRDQAAGRRMRCRNCETPISVPPADAVDQQSRAKRIESARPPVVRSRKKKVKTAPKRRARSSKLTVANGLRIVLAGLLLQVVAMLAGLIPLSAPLMLVLLLLNLTATMLAITGQAMCLTAPGESGIRPLIFGVIGLQGMSIFFRVASLLIPLLSILSALSAIAAFFLFVYALKRLASFAGSATGEMHAEWILYWGAGLVFLTTVPRRFVRFLGPEVGGPLVWVVGLAGVVVCGLVLIRYIDLLGCLKDELDVA